MSQCQKLCWGERGSSWQCPRKGPIQEKDRNGKVGNFCKQHAPSTQAAKDKAWRISFDAKREKDQRRYAREEAQYELMRLIVKIPTHLFPNELLQPIAKWLNNKGLEES